MNPIEIAMGNLMWVLKAAAGLFVFKIGLSIFNASRYQWIIDMLILASLATIVIGSLSGFMTSAESISKGVWPK
jgi:hypothetical protein